MSLYTIGEILVWLLLAAILGFILGWLIRGLRPSGEPEPAPAVKEARTRVVEIARSNPNWKDLPKDDLERIHGVGPKIAKLLRSLDIVSFQQVADFTPSDIATVSEALETFPDRIERDNWMASARELEREVHGERTRA